MATTLTPLYVRGRPIEPTHDAVADFVLNNPTLVLTLTVGEKLDLLRVLGLRVDPAKVESGCQRYQEAAIKLLQKAQQDPAELGAIARGLGGARWLRVNACRFMDPELARIANAAQVQSGDPHV